MFLSFLYNNIRNIFHVLTVYNLHTNLFGIIIKMRKVFGFMKA